MWNDDGNWETYRNRDEEIWDAVRDGQIHTVQRLIDFLIDLGVVKLPSGQFNLGTHWGFDTAGFVDRHWKV